MGLYERLLQERVEEEERQDEPLRTMRGKDSKVLVRRLEGSNRRPGYAADLSMMYRLIKKPSERRGGHAAGKSEGQIPQGVQPAEG